ncbi:MobA/MobL family protein [Dorea formicigenerans]|nr:MobA/MobL family protein [Dorea formicigenerans]MCB8576721.1 MobA/MobL family protein [Dorea formicigenerans]MCG4712079.1 MobA/MobL family protein [Dorea formicigenerans]
MTYTNAVAFGYAGYGNKPTTIPLILSVRTPFPLAEEGEESTLTTRHSFIQMTKLSNVRGRITYISSHAKQEHLYAVYETTERSYWTELARCSQQEFKKSGVEGNCIEARELIIALPESLYEQGMPDMLLKSFTDKFKEKYGVECVAALHHNKRMTNFHIHLIFSERQLLAEPVIKIATRNMFYDEHGNHVRTKKEILDEAGNIRKRCKVIGKGEVYEKKLFTSKNTRFKQEDFLDEVKLFYTRMINHWVTDEKDRLTVFDRNGPYLATKKIGRNNPKAEQIEQDNKLRMDWNREVDRAIISNVPMDDILQIKREHITEPIKRSIEIYGNKPQRLALILNMAITELVLLISKVLEAARAIRNKILHTDVTNAEKTDFASNIVVDNTDNTSAIEESTKVENKITTQEETIKEVNVTKPDKAVMTPEAATYPKLKKIKAELDNQNNLIFQAEQQRGNLEIELSDLKGLAKLTRKAELQRKIDEKTDYINRLKIGLSNMVRNYGFENMNEFYLSYKESQNAYAEYQQEVDDWKKSNDNAETPMNKTEMMSEKLARLQKDVGKFRQNNRRTFDKEMR